MKMDSHNTPTIKKYLVSQLVVTEESRLHRNDINISTVVRIVETTSSAYAIGIFLEKIQDDLKGRRLEPKVLLLEGVDIFKDDSITEEVEETVTITKKEYELLHKTNCWEQKIVRK